MEKVYTTNELIEILSPIFDTNLVERAILFGSYARGNPAFASDVDILIDSKGKLKGIDFFGVLDEITETLRTQVDLFEASQLVDGGRVQREIADSGIVIYERA